jgi:cellulose synthase/poly-beta-1,6-N-acetylglucosamine synthase-like glycosyltransferase
MLKIVFLILFLVVVYTYLGYAIVIWILANIKQAFAGKVSLPDLDEENLPAVCLFVTAYNEADVAEQKVQNSFSLNYPKDKIQYLWMTDGSDDGTSELLKKYPQLQVEHIPERQGKIRAMNRGMQFVKAPLVIFSDSNTLLGENAILEIVGQFEDPKTGCVAGEKRIVEKDQDSAAASGEGMYWRLESFIKRMDALFNSAVGAAGELFAIRTHLFEEVEADTLLDDFVISLRIAAKGYRIAYSPEAYAVEAASVSINEELKRKTRIAAGGVQSIFRLPHLLNPFKHGWLSFQYFSHKVLRWTIAPIALFLLFIVNFLILNDQHSWTTPGFYTVLFYAQAVMYLIAIIGWLFANRQIRFKLFFIPFYFVAMNYASIVGIIRYLKDGQSVVWEKAKRAKV